MKLPACHPDRSFARKRETEWRTLLSARKLLAVKAITSCLLLIVVCASCVAPSQRQSAKADNWALRYDGIGSVKVGMTLGQLNAALGENFPMPKDKEEQTCFYVEPKQHPDTSIMILENRVARVDVFASKNAAPSTSTAEGIHIGDSEARVEKLYGSKIEVSPHAYTDTGHYLTIRFGNYGMRFETDQGKVTGFYGGRLDAISFIEGCL